MSISICSRDELLNTFVHGINKWKFFMSWILFCDLQNCFAE